MTENIDYTRIDLRARQLRARYLAALFGRRKH